MDNVKQTSTIMNEHRSVVLTRYLLAIFNFIAILVGTLLTAYFVTRRGAPDLMRILVYALIAINVIQLLLCVADFASRVFFGAYIKVFVALSYIFGVVWIAVLAGELVVGTLDLGGVRIDLLAIAVAQVLIAILAYFVWPSLDRRALDAMTRRSVRNNVTRRRSKAVGIVIMYIIMCFIIVFAQFAVLFLYKLPPTVYDLFSDTRALEYALTSSGDSYEVVGIYQGTSTVVNVPATYNNLPVVGIASGAISQTALDGHKIETITLGTVEVDDNGNETVISNLRYISNGAITSDAVTAITIPETVTSIGRSAIAGSSLKSIVYQSAANFDIGYFNCPNLETITLEGDNVGRISSINGMSKNVTLNVNKDIYNEYRKENPEYIDRFQPLLDENEICVDFYTNCDVYIESIIGYAPITVSKELLRNTKLYDDTQAYLLNRYEVGTNGAKANAAFRGWYFSSDMSVSCDMSVAHDFTSSTTLYAKWVDEYSANVRWGNYTPTGSEEVTYKVGNTISGWNINTTMLYWTDEAELLTEFPTVKGRTGYEAGVQWTVNGNVVKDSGNVRGNNLTLTANWLLDAPTVRMESSTQGSFVLESDEIARLWKFTYDEQNKLNLKGTTEHVLGSDINYSYEWRRLGSSDVITQSQGMDFTNVADSGKYILTVKAQSYSNGEISSKDTDVTVEIAKKAIDIGGITLSNYTNAYSGSLQKIDLDEGKIVTSNISVTYAYFNKATGNLDAAGDKNTGVFNAGNYTLRVTFAKNNSTEADNYAETVLEADFTITQLQLQFDKWQLKQESSVVQDDSSIVYNGKLYVYEIVFKNFTNVNALNLTYNTTLVNSVASKIVGVSAGTYETTVELNNSNYTFDQIPQENLSKTWTIAPLKVSVASWTLDGKSITSITYDGETHTAAASVSGGHPVNFIYETQQGTNQGSYVTRITGVDDDNYTHDGQDAKISFSWTIAQRKLAVSGSAVTNATYTGVSQQFYSYTVSNIVPSEVSKFVTAINVSEVFNLGGTTADVVSVRNGTTGDSVVVNFAATNATSYTCALQSLQSGGWLDNYALAEAKENSASIAKAKLTFENSGSYTYNATAQELKLIVHGIVEEDIKKGASELLGIFTKTNLENAKIESGKLVLIHKETDAGNYPFSVTGTSNANYTVEESDKISSNFTIQKATISITSWSITNNSTNVKTALSNGGSYTYNGKSKGYTVSVNFSGKQGSDVVTLNVSNASAATANSYTSTAKLDDLNTKNYQLASTNTSVTWNITQFELTVTWNRSWNTNSTSVVYDGGEKSVSGTLNSFTGDNVYLVVGSGATGTNAAAYTATSLSLSGDDAGNYRISSDLSYNWSITARQVTVTWNNYTGLTYSGSNLGPTLRLSNLVQSDIDSNQLYIRITSSSINNVLITGTSIALANTSSAVTNAGSYTFVANSIYSGNSATSATLNSNYTVVSNSILITVEKKTVDVTWNYSNTGLSGNTSGTLSSGKHFDYNGVAYNLSASASGTDASGLAFSYTYSSATNAGTYTTTATPTNSNYQVSASTSSITWYIDPVPVSVSWSGDSVVMYDGQRHSISVTLNGVLSVDSSKNITLVTTGVMSETNAGTYTVQVTGLNNAGGNYVLNTGDTNLKRTWQIKPYTITDLKWSGSSFTYNGAEQRPTATFTFNSNSNYPVSDYVYSTSKNVGSYTITANPGTNFVFGSGVSGQHSYSITAVELALNWGNTNLTYNGSEQCVYAQVVGLLDVDKNNVTIGYGYTQGTSPVSVSPTNAGEYKVTARLRAGLSGDSTGNYVIKSGNETITYTINKAQVTITWTIDGGTDMSPIVRDGMAHVLKVVVTGVNGQQLYTYSKSLTNIGSVEIEVTESTLGSYSKNYSLDGVTTKQTLTIYQQSAESDSIVSANMTAVAALPTKESLYE